MSDFSKNLDELIENEKRELAKEFFHETWLELIENEVNPRVIAEIFIEATLKELSSEQGNMVTSELIAHFKDMDDKGFILSNRTLQ